jgi:hypothetical protein
MVLYISIKGKKKQKKTLKILFPRNIRNILNYFWLDLILYFYSIVNRIIRFYYKKKRYLNFIKFIALMRYSYKYYRNI